jgi:thiol-disulfide isomerase/thioredoxin
MLVNFWATWCAPCLREIPMLKEFHDEHESIEVIGIAVDRVEPVVEYAADMVFNYPILVGQANAYEAMATFRNEAQVMPFSAFTAPGGAVLGVHYGELHPEHLENFAATIELLNDGLIDLAEARAHIAAVDAHADHDH